MPLITLRGARMVKSMFGLVIENNKLYSFTRCCRLKANEGKASDSPILSQIFSVFSCRFPLMFSSTKQQPCSLTDSFTFVKTHAKRTGSYSGNSIVRVSGLSLLTMPPCEQKTAKRLLRNHFGLFSSSRYSLALLGLKGDQNLIC
ncbi:hypothetical protein CWS43_09510 [Rahnella sp. AA]|nr:hypothetical protein CWS43_09510 [Rahnella sp. AA]